MIRALRATDRAEWLRMRHLLWPREVKMEESADEIYAGRIAPRPIPPLRHHP